MTPLNVVMRNYPHTTIIKNGTVPIEGVACQFPENAPSDPDFPYTVHRLDYDVAETTIVTFLQAREAGHPITLLPIVLHGGFHHRSMKRWAGEQPLTPFDFKGKKIGLRSYAQPGGLWVRGLLKEEYGIEPCDMKWVTSEVPFVKSYVEPSFVERTKSPLTALLRDGEIISLITTGAVVVANAAHAQSETLQIEQVIADTSESEQGWFSRHHTIPVNHLVTVQTELLNSTPAVVRSIFRAFTTAIEETKLERGSADSARVIAAGLTDQLVSAVDVAIRYGLEQELIREEISAEELFTDSMTYRT